MNRLVCKGQTYETELVLDIACEVFTIREGERFTMHIVSTLSLDNKPDDDKFNQDGKVRWLARCSLGCGLTRARTSSHPPPRHYHHSPPAVALGLV